MMQSITEIIANVPREIRVGLVVAVTAVIGLIAAQLLLVIAGSVIRQSPRLSLFLKVKRLRPPLFIAVPMLMIFLALDATFPDEVRGPFFSGLVRVTTVGLLYWLAIRIIDIVTEAISRRYDITVKDNLRARQVRTRIVVVRRIVSILVFIVALSAIFLMFQHLRALGVSLLASAGIAGIVLGFAAQKTLGNLLAGITIALTQPIRIEDAVVVENEWGWVEEITLAYVVVRLWDLRRLVLPISYLLEHPFQNWTRTSANLIGTVELFADYTLPIEPLRKELLSILSQTPLWDGKVQTVQVTDCDAQAMKIRILVSAGDSGSAFDLRCHVREKMIAFLQNTYPQSLPTRRAVIAATEPFLAVH